MNNYSLTQLNAYGITEDDVLSATQTLANADAPKLTGNQRINCLIIQDDVEVSKAAKIVTYIARSNPLCLL